jgi:hypothetical protein
VINVLLFGIKLILLKSDNSLTLSSSLSLFRSNLYIPLSNKPYKDAKKDISIKI